jgi:hypothetical protein
VRSYRIDVRRPDEQTEQSFLNSFYADDLRRAELAKRSGDQGAPQTVRDWQPFYLGQRQLLRHTRSAYANLAAVIRSSRLRQRVHRGASAGRGGVPADAVDDLHRLFLGDRDEVVHCVAAFG